MHLVIISFPLVSLIVVIVVVASTLTHVLMTSATSAGTSTILLIRATSPTSSNVAVIMSLMLVSGGALARRRLGLLKGSLSIRMERLEASCLCKTKLRGILQAKAWLVCEHETIDCLLHGRKLLVLKGKSIVLHKQGWVKLL
jgi:hypothetical protein